MNRSLFYRTRGLGPCSPCCIPAIALILLFSGCAGATKHTRSSYDTFERTTVDRMVNHAVSPRVFERSRVYLNARREQPVEDEPNYFLQVEFFSVDDFTLAAGESLIVAIDGERRGLSATNSPVAIPAKRGFTSVQYKVSAKLLAEIANSKEAALRLRGLPNPIEKEISRSNRRELKKFLVKYDIARLVDPAGAPGRDEAEAVPPGVTSDVPSESRRQSISLPAVEAAIPAP